MVPMRDIRAFARKIAAEFKPRRIILFGSYANGKQTEDSDVDILVVMKCTMHPVDQSIEIRRRIRSGFPLDLLVYQPTELSERLRQGDFFLQEIVERGAVLHDARHTRVA